MARNGVFVRLLCVLCGVILPACSLSYGQNPFDISWSHAKWVKKDDLYHSVRSRIESIANDRALLESVIQKARVDCLGNKPNSVAVYQWAYAFYLRCRGDYDYFEKHSNSVEFMKPSLAFKAAGDYGSYEFTRVRFLFSVVFEYPHHSLVDVGERLFAKERNIYVGRALLRLYQPQAWSEDLKKGRTLADWIEATDPNSLSTLWSVGFFYHLCWRKSKSRMDAESSLKRLTKLAAQTNSEQQRKNTNIFIKMMTQ